MVGKCQCGKIKYNMHNSSLTEIPWLCFECRGLNESIKKIVHTQVKREPEEKSKLKRPMFSFKRRLQLA